MNRHTQGQWHLSVNNGWTTNPFSIVVRKTGVHRTTIVNIPTRKTVSAEEQAANARLIAAAPDLLAALKALVEDQRDASLPVLAQAREAIEKAEGVRNDL